MFEIIRSKVEQDINRDFVALGFLIYGDNNDTHSAFVIQHKGVLSEFHFTGKIESSELKHDYYHKITYSIHPDEVPAFIASCQQIKKKANPIYGYFYSGESYDSDGNHFGNKDLGQRMTCVGFCLNVLKGFLEDDYLQYTDWNEESHKCLGYLEWYCEKHKVDISMVKTSHRRIAPIELLTSGFFNNFPIRKIHIDGKLEDVTSIIQAKQLSEMN